MTGTRPPLLEAPQTDTTPRGSTLRVARSFACDRETRELAEDYVELKRVDRAHRLLERRLARAAIRLYARRAVATVTEFSLLLSDARHDSSWAATLELAAEAAEECGIVRIARRFPSDV